MSDEELEVYIKTIEPNFDSHLEKGTIEMSNEYYNLLEEKMVRLINKNQELKKQLEDTNEELELVRCDLHNRTSERDSYYKNIELLETQQQEFIKWLEDYLKLFDNMCIDEQGYYDMFEEILQKIQRKR